jgi:hypothetical protein
MRSLRLQDAFLERHGVKLGFMSAFVKAAGAALQYVPAVNGVIDGNDIIYRCATAPTPSPLLPFSHASAAVHSPTGRSVGRRPG